MTRTTICVAVILSVLGGGCRLSEAAESVSKAFFAYGAINAYMTSIWIAKEQGFFRKHNVEVEPVFIIATQAAKSRSDSSVPLMWLMRWWPVATWS